MTTKGRGKEPLVFSRTEQRAIVIEALGIVPNVWQVYRCLEWAPGIAERIGVAVATEALKRAM